MEEKKRLGDMLKFSEELRVTTENQTPVSYVQYKFFRAVDKTGVFIVRN